MWAGAAGVKGGTGYRRGDSGTQGGRQDMHSPRKGKGSWLLREDGARED